MVHTVEFMIVLTKDDLANIIEGLEVQKDTALRDEKKSMTLTIKKGVMKQNISEGSTSYVDVWRAFIIVDLIKLLGTADIYESDLKLIIRKIEDFLFKYVKSDSVIELIRIEYRYDAYIDNQSERALLFKLYRKCQAKKSYMKQKPEKYKTTLTYCSKSRSNIFYDKEVQLRNTGREVQEYEKGVLRYEAKILPRHTYYQLKSNNLERSLASYFTEEMYKKYMNKMIINVVYRGNYYNVYQAKKLLMKSKNLKNLEKHEALAFMLLISKSRSVTKAIEVIGSYKAKKYIEKLQAEDINPILIPKCEKVSKMSNPLKNLYGKWEKEQKYAT